MATARDGALVRSRTQALGAIGAAGLLTLLYVARRFAHRLAPAA